MKILYCKTCKNITLMLEDNGPKLKCCMRKMIELTANTTDAALEKHVPSVKVENGLVEVIVGDIMHPQTMEHNISFIILETNQGEYVKYLSKGEDPKASFKLIDGEKVIAVYAYCNLHGLWKKSL